MNPSISPKTILIVDDEPLILEAMVMLLELDGHNIETADDGKSALKKLDSCGFDIVFTDLTMPRISGQALAMAIKKQSPQQIVVMVTGRAEPLNRKHSESASFDFSLSKPFQLQELRDIIRRATLKQDAQTPEFNFMCKLDWLTVQRHLHKGGHEEHTHPFGHKGAVLV